VIVNMMKMAIPMTDDSVYELVLGAGVNLYSGSGYIVRATHIVHHILINTNPSKFVSTSATEQLLRLCCHMKETGTQSTQKKPPTPRSSLLMVSKNKHYQAHEVYVI